MTNFENNRGLRRLSDLLNEELSERLEELKDASRVRGGAMMDTASLARERLETGQSNASPSKIVEEMIARAVVESFEKDIN